MSAGGRFDWLVELGGAAAPAACFGFAAFKLAPLLGAAAPAAMAGGSLTTFALALGAMRMVAPEPRQLAMPEFQIEPIEILDELLLESRHEEPLLLEELYKEPDEALLLEDSHEEVLLLEEPYKEPDEALLLEDRLGAPAPDSRVVQLFAPHSMPTPAQLKARIDRHLAGERPPPTDPVAAPMVDASDALYAALTELRRSLR